MSAPIMPSMSPAVPIAEGHAWVQEKLNQMLSGLEAKTPRAHVVATEVPHIYRATLTKRKIDMKPR